MRINKTLFAIITLFVCFARVRWFRVSIKNQVQFERTLNDLFMKRENKRDFSDVMFRSTYAHRLHRRWLRCSVSTFTFRWKTEVRVRNAVC